MTDKQETIHAFARSLSNAGLGATGRSCGKSAAMEKQVAAFLRKNPNATIARVLINGARIEKTVEGEVVLPLLLDVPNSKLSTGQRREEE